MSRENELRANLADVAGGGGVVRIITGGAYVQTPGQTCFDCVLAAASADITILLLDASLVPGMIVSVFVSASDGTNDVVVTGPGVGSDYSSGDLDATGDNIIVRSDGLRWTAIAATVA